MSMNTGDDAASTPHENAVDAAALAEILGVTRESIYRYARTGEIIGFRVGRAWRFYPSEVRAHLARPRERWAQSRRSIMRPRR